ncbi:MAG: biotin transporter BioY [Chloroflexota bacterium]
MTSARLARIPASERGITLGDFLVPIRFDEWASARQRDILLVIAGALLILAGAYISIPIPAIAIGEIYIPDTPYVPLTLQTFGVLFTGALLGARRGLAASGLYLALGAIGLPVFAAGSDGVHAAGLDTIASMQDGRLVLGVTGGYLVAFILAGAFVGRLAELGWDRRLVGSTLAMLFGTVVIYVIGVPWLAIAANLSVDQALHYGLFPFLPGDILKLVVAAGILPIGWRLVSRRDVDL